MPAGVWVLPLAVGDRARPIAKSQRVERVGGSHSNESNDPGRGRMAALDRQTQERRIDDTVLIREAQRGNRAAFEELVRHYDQAVLRLALHLTGTEQDAQDVYQDAFLKAYKNIGSFRFECSFYTWIYRIVTNLCLDHLRKRNVRKEDAPVAKDSSGGEYDSARPGAGRAGGSESGARLDAAAAGSADFGSAGEADSAGAHGV